MRTENPATWRSLVTTTKAAGVKGDTIGGDRRGGLEGSSTDNRQEKLL